jgi:hypothetical protein
MIHVTLRSTEIEFRDDKAVEPVKLYYRDHPAEFGHPRHLIQNPRMAAELIRPILRSLSFLAPKVEFTIEPRLEGGIARVDLMSIVEAFTLAGSRSVTPSAELQARDDYKP